MPMTDAQLKRQQDGARHYQRLYDDALQLVGMRAPEPTLGQSVNDYRRESLRTMKKAFLQNHELNKVNMRGLPDDALPIFEGKVLTAVPVEAFNPMNVPKGQIKEIVQTQPNGQKIHQFIGQDSFVRDMTVPGRRVRAFCKHVETVQDFRPKTGWAPTTNVDPRHTIP
jgi:hypothetical protein